jgi:hypothetical protein
MTGLIKPQTPMPESDLTRITWRLDAYAGHWLSTGDLTAVTDWMTANRLRRATAERPVTVANGVIVYGQDWSLSHIRARDRTIITVTVPLRTAPPDVWQPDCGPAELAELLEVFRWHEWTSGFGGSCVDCSRTRREDDGRLWCYRDDAAPWPCPPVREALAKAGMPVPPVVIEQRSPRVLGDCLDPAANARAFGR